jgi:KDO2-lipid IV(A) lauroyltransferase
MTLAILGLVRVLPEDASYRMGAALARFAYRVWPRFKRVSLANLDIFFRDSKTPGEKERIALAAFVNLGYTFIEFMRMGFLPKEKVLAMIVETRGVDALRAALAEGKGVIGLGMHYGNWELSGAYMPLTGIPLAAVGKEQTDDFFTNIAFPYRERLGVTNIYRADKASSAVIRTLRTNQVLGLLADQNAGASGEFVDFAGRKASTFKGPAALHMKFGSPMTVIVAERISPGRLRFIAEPPLDLNDLPLAEDARAAEIARRMNAAYERVIRRDPTQWLWVHKRWKTRPPDEKGTDLHNVRPG